MSESKPVDADVVESERRKLSTLAAIEARQETPIMWARRVFLKMLLAGARVVTADDEQQS